jgi:hypothetical protein
MTMKTLRFILVALVLLFSSCTKNEDITPLLLTDFEYMTSLSRLEVINYIETYFSYIILEEEQYDLRVYFNYKDSRVEFRPLPNYPDKTMFFIYGKTGFAKNTFNEIKTSENYELTTIAGGLSGEWEEIGKEYYYDNNSNPNVCYILMVVFDPVDWHKIIEGGELYYHIIVHPVWEM